jgi:hypothetical protein
MKQPDKILRSGTIVITNAELDLTTGFLVKKKHIDARVANRRGVIKGIVPGHGGDVYWVWHRGSDGVAAYGWREFELAEPRRVYFIPVDGLVEGEGFRVSVVTEGEPGHTPTGTWPYSGDPGETAPYFWGDDYKKACAIAREQNAKMGITQEDELEIIASSMFA